MTPEQERAESDRTADLLALADVRRWGVIKTVRPQSVAEHTFGVIVIAMELYNRLCVPNTTTLLHTMMWAMWHDAPETLTGDIDGRFKRDNLAFKAALNAAEIRELPWYGAAQEFVGDSVRWLVKVADYIETISFIQTFGIGPKADDVMHELTALLFDKAVPNLTESLRTFAPNLTTPLDVEDVIIAVRGVLHNSTSENNSHQLRRHRRP